MSSTDTDSVLFKIDASNFAFAAGQLFERLLLDRAEALAREAQSQIVTVEHVRSCIDVSLMEGFKRRLDERFKPKPRKVA